MKRLSIRILALGAAFVLLSGGECELGDLGIINKPGMISVTNIGSETAVVAILADDVKSYPTLAAGQLASIQTNVGGRYEVRVVMTPENTQRYRDNLATLRSLVEREIDGSASAAERIRLFLDLVGIKAAIRALESSNAAGCSGRIKLAADEDTDVIATVNWVATSGAGFWDATCGSN